MPQRPEDLSKIIREMAERHAKQLGLAISSEALVTIGIIPADFAQQTTIDVDLDKLDMMIGEVIGKAKEGSDGITITRRNLGTALRRVNCHYLWFC